jgi:hypothetical protein
VITFAHALALTDDLASCKKSFSHCPWGNTASSTLPALTRAEAATSGKSFDRPSSTQEFVIVELCTATIQYKILCRYAAMSWIGGTAVRAELFTMEAVPCDFSLKRKPQQDLR